MRPKKRPTRHRSVLSPQSDAVVVDGAIVPWRETVTYLGVDFDEQLRFTRQVDKARGRATFASVTLERYKRQLPMRVRTRIYKSLILPHLEYGGVVFNSISAADDHKLEVAQNDALRSASGYRRRYQTSRVTLYTQHQMQPLKARREVSLLQQVHAVAKGAAPQLIAELFANREHHLHDTRAKDTFRRSRAQKKILQDGFVHRGTIAYEKLRSETKQCVTKEAFRAAVLKEMGHVYVSARQSAAAPTQVTA